MSTGGRDDGPALARLARRRFPSVLHALELAPDARTLAAAGTSPMAEVALIDLATGEPRAALAGLGRVAVGALAFSPDGTALAAGGATGQVALWDVASGALRAREKVSRAAVRTLSFTPGGELLWVASGERRAAVLDAATLATRGGADAVDGVVRAAVACSATHALLDVAPTYGTACTLRRCELGGGAGEDFAPSAWAYEALVRAGDGAVAAVAGAELSLWDPARGVRLASRAVKALREPAGAWRRLQWLPGPRALALIGRSDFLVWSPGRDVLRVAALQVERAAEKRRLLRAAVLLPDGRTLACASDRNSLELWTP